jgi:DNA-binding response OmpR family regulator
VIAKSMGKPKKAKILVIDDKDTIRRNFFDILTSSDHEVETATDSTQGLEMFRKGQYDMVFTDLSMPGMSGFQLAKKIKNINNIVPVILITGWKIEMSESELKDNGVDLVLGKPFHVYQVLEIVQNLMTLRDEIKAL